MNKIIYILIISITMLYGKTKEVGINHLNEIRKGTKLNELKENYQLWKSSKNHTNYIKNNEIEITHVQNLSNMFSGKHPWNRAEYVGYNNKMVSENISSGVNTYKESIDLLMTAIYHRFGFLDFNIDEIGMFKNEEVVTYNMGNSEIRKICEKKGGEVGIDICNTKNKIKIEDVEKIKKIERKNPEYIIYPYENSINNLPTFYDEEPDPIPDRNITGNPISIQFNSSKVKELKIEEFKLYEGFEEIKKTRLLNKNTDPNKRFTNLEYALFPLEKLKWGKRYTVEIKGKLNGKRFEKKWDFYTKKLNGDIYIVKNIKNYEIWRNKQYYLSFEPEIFGRISKYITNCEGIEFIDYNTIGLKINKDCFLQIKEGKIGLKIK